MYLCVTPSIVNIRLFKYLLISLYSNWISFFNSFCFLYFLTPRPSCVPQRVDVNKTVCIKNDIRIEAEIDGNNQANGRYKENERE